LPLLALPQLFPRRLAMAMLYISCCLPSSRQPCEYRFTSRKAQLIATRHPTTRRRKIHGESL
jgi:hypothetical protein